MKVLICLNSDFAAFHWRKGLIKALLARGIDVTVVTPDGPCVPQVIALGAKHVAVPMSGLGSPWRVFRLYRDLYRVFRDERPDILHTMTIKPNLVGGLAARAARVPKVVALVNGLGHTYSDYDHWTWRVLRLVVSRLYRRAFRNYARVWFQNPDDLAFFVEANLISADKAVLIRGSGVDVREYRPDGADQKALAALRAELGIDASTQVVLMLARAMSKKGVREFVEASQLAARWRRPVVFLLAGPLAPGGPGEVSETFLRSTTLPHFRWLGFRHDVRLLFALADVVTLPSYYREGVPRSLLEALAMGKPIVTTDHVGCRETVDDGQNGFLVPVRDSAALASAIEKLIRDAELRERFGRHSLVKARAEFDEALVVRRVLKELYGLDEPEPAREPLRAVA
jgi:N,N'-diacetylbacillosaminyl-diphospho-undecaprenol alpha-1,3-N-acetylgalactosaminyltransferase